MPSKNKHNEESLKQRQKAFDSGDGKHGKSGFKRPGSNKK